MEPRLILINLLVKLGVAAAVSSSLVRSKEFKSLLFREERTFRQKVYLVLWFALPIMVGVWIRISQTTFQASDISFETAFLLSCTGNGPPCHSTCCVAFLQVSFGPWPSIRMISGPSRRSSTRACSA